MSSVVNSANKPNLYNEDTEALYDPYPIFSSGTSCAELLWPEWSDAELNAETWEEGKGRLSTATASALKITSAVRPPYDDPNPPELPPGLSEYVSSWKRCKDVLLTEESENETLVVYDPSRTDFELELPSPMSRECEFFQTFIEDITLLQYYSLNHRFLIELENPNFVPTTQGEPWHPWHQVYALCKAGKGQVHKPLYCPYGKYIVRLYYLGAWRRFVVDDKIPCDIEGNCLLPLVKNSKELWPIIVVKALLKVLSLTPTNDFSATDCHIISFFTGWTAAFFFTKRNKDLMWERMLLLLPHYEQPKSEDRSIRNAAGRKESARRDTLRESLAESRKESFKDNTSTEIDTETFCFLLARVHSTDFSISGSININMTRDCPLIKANRREKTKPWKKLRWIQWAKERGLWVDNTLLPPFRRILIISINPALRRYLSPDPKLETALYDIPIEETDAAKCDINDPIQWSDFLKFLDSVSELHIYFKPSCFFATAKISCLAPRSPENSWGVKGLTKPGAAPLNSFIFPSSVKPTCNEPIFLLCEGHSGIFLFISLAVYPRHPLTNDGYLQGDQPKLLQIGHGAVIVEVDDWRSCEQGEIVGFLKTVGNSTLTMNLKAGRYVLKIWLSTDTSPYVIDIYSNSSIFVSNSSRIRFLMANEPQRILNYINNLSNSFINLTLKFGKPDFPKALRDFYNSVRPGNDLNSDYFTKLDIFIETFLNCILLLLRELISNPEEVSVMLGAMRSLFINPYLTCDLPVPSVGKKAAEPKKEPESYISNQQPDVKTAKAIIIQKFFRGYRVRLLWKFQTPARKEFKLYNERLKRICDTIFVPSKRDNEVGNLLRKIVMHRPDVLKTFRFYEDFTNVLDVEGFTGKMTSVEPYAWVPITRFIIGCHSEGLVPCIFHLSCNLERVVIQGFNNDTGEELFRVSNSLSPHYYSRNSKGYTIFACGWNEANYKTVNWRLEIVKMKHFPAIHLCNLLMSTTCRPYGMPSLDIFEVRNVYVPNSKSRICRCLIKIHRRALLTLRLCLSYSDVQFELIISLEKGSSSENLSASESDVVHKVVSKNGVIIVPALVLESNENPWKAESMHSNPIAGNMTVFSVEAFVLNNSWPLTKQEWGLVEPLRVNGTNGENGKESLTSILSKRGGRPESRKKLGRFSKKNLIEQKLVDNPVWLLQVLNDAIGPESGETIVIEEDKSSAEFVRAMKASWREKDPGRKKKGREMRMKFLHKMHIEERKSKLCAEDEENCEGEVEGEDPQLVLDRLSSFSYLTNDTSPTRYTYSPRILPNMPLLELLSKYRKQPEPSDLPAAHLMATKESISDDDQTELSFSIQRNMIDETEEDRKDFSRQCSHFRSVLTNHIQEELRFSSRLMEQAYEERLKGLENFTR